MAYYQNNGFGSQFPVVTRNLLIINVAVCLACFLFRNLVDYLALYHVFSPQFRIYQLVTYMFTHVTFDHLFFNMFALFMFGSTLENYWGTKRYLTYYMVTGIGAGLIQLLVMLLTHINAPTIGASGAVFGLLLAFGMLFPNTPLYFMFIPVPIKAKWMVLGYGLVELFFGVAGFSMDNVAHFAHLGGMLFGIILILYWRKKDANSGWSGGQSETFLDKLKKKFEQKPKSDAYKRPETDWEYNARRASEQKDIDRILDKIKFSGYDSLSEAEKKQLFNAGNK